MAYSDLSAQQGGQDSFFDQFFGGSNQQQEGAVYIQEVIGGKAKKAGFKPGDMVYSIDDTRIDSIETLSSVITSHKVGDKVVYVIVRDYEKITLPLILSEKTNS
jgi:S1-C subfamily serine protease